MCSGGDQIGRKLLQALSTEIAVGAANGLEHDSVVNCDNIITVPKAVLGRHLGYSLPAQEAELADAVRAAFDLD